MNTRNACAFKAASALAIIVALSACSKPADPLSVTVPADPAPAASTTR